MKYLSKSEKETEALAKKIALEIKKRGGIVGLIGNLGSGKTIFAKGFAKGLGITEKVTSPTFIIVRQYNLLQERFFYHVDLYRLDKVNSKQIGLDEILRNKKNIILIEWADKLNKLSKNSIVVKFNKTSEDVRIINIEHDKQKNFIF